jgi:hypothetical protein
VTDAEIRRLPAGGGAAGTNWGRYTLDEIWHMVSTEDSHVTDAQVGAWRRMAELCVEQADQLERATKQLLQRWPARPGSASEAFTHQVTSLVASMRQTARAATANQQPLLNITNALTTARYEIGALVETWQHYALIEQQLTPQPTPSPGQTPIPPASPGLQPPPQDWRAELQQQARTIMTRTDTTIGTEATQIQKPTPYVFSPIFETTNPLDPGTGGGGGGGSVGAGRMGGSVGISGSSQHTFVPTHPQFSSGVGLPPLTDGSGAHGDADPILSGGPHPGPSAIGPPGTPAVNGGPPSGGSTSFITTPYGTVLAPGGTIGVRASAPVAQTSGRAPGATAETKTGAGVPGRAGSQGAMPMAPMVPPRGGRPSRSSLPPVGRLGRGGRNRQSHADPDDPWAVAEGGPAILEPPPEPTEHDPGPGVIGLNR